MAAAVEVLVLGPTRLLVDGAPVELGSGRQRAILAALALSPGRVVTIDELVELLWGDEPPDNARGNLQSYVSRLRRHVGSDVLTHEHGGYALHIDPTATDLGRVEALVREARATADPAAAAELLRQAREAWRGPPLMDVSDLVGLAPEVARLEELRRTLTDDHHTALLEAGRPDEALPSLERAAAADPLRERTQLLLVRALHAVGRAAEALRWADRYRRELAEQTGLDPGPELAELEESILAGTPPARPTAKARSSPRPAPAGLPRHGRLVGRHQELTALPEHLETASVVTVAGPGGVGKTRLVAEALAARQDVVAAVELAGVNADEVDAAVASCLDLQSSPGDLRAAIVEYLSTETGLVVLDNCEHVAAAVADLVADLTDNAPGLTLLTTSRVPLGVAREVVLRLDPLPVETEAVELFSERAAAAGVEVTDEERTTAEAICRRLDGLPLALELAAGRLPSLGLTNLTSHLDEALDLLERPGGSRDRHGTLEEVVDWSYRLLDDPAKRALEAASVFEGGFPLDALEAVAGDLVEGSVAGATARLVEASLLVVDLETTTRYRLLETVRHHARRRLAERDPSGELFRRHAAWVVQLVTEVVLASAGPDEHIQIRRGLAERGNVRAALRWATADGDVEVAARLATGLGWLVLYRPDAEALGWLSGIPDVAGIDDAETGVGALGAAARAALVRGELDTAEVLARRALDAAGGGPAFLAWHTLGVRALYDARHQEAESWFLRALERPEAPVVARLDALGGLALARAYAGDLKTAGDWEREHAALADLVDSDLYRAFNRYIQGELALVAGAEGAVDLLEEAVELARPSRAAFVMGVAETTLVSALVRGGRHREALRRFPRLLELWRRSGIWPQLWTSLRLLAELLLTRGAEERTALVILEAADRHPSAPAGTEEAHLSTLRAEAAGRLGPAASGIAATAASLPRARVLEEARQAVDRLLAEGR